jgi:hypothetical protein
MTEATYRKLLGEFLNVYWPAFHEAVEAQSVTPSRLAGSLFDGLVAAHKAFEAACDGRARAAVGELGQIWNGLRARRVVQPDPAFHAGEIGQAREHFRELYLALLAEGADYPEVTRRALQEGRHGTPLEPLRATPAS